MGSIAALEGKRVYLDANIVIYILERPAGVERELASLIDAITRDAMTCITAELTITEVLAGAAKSQNPMAVATCIDFFENGDVVTLRETSREAFYKAGLLRAAHDLKTPDALHVASALDANCAFFLTNDRRLRAPDGLAIMQLREI
jgi:predicted nucleic acid-binding protein